MRFGPQREVFHRHWGEIRDSANRVVIRLRRNPSTHRLWFLESPITHTRAMHTSASDKSTARLWHLRLGHSHPDSVIKFLNVHKNISLCRKDFSSCDSCEMGKLSQSPATSSFHRAPGVLHLIHSDILGPIHPPTASGARYILTFIDDYTRHNTIDLLKCKSGAFEKFKEYKSLMENRMSAKIVKLKSDRGGEYSSNEFLKFMKENGIQIERGPADRPQANSVSERFNRTILSKIRSQLIESGLPLHLWGEAAVYSSLQINCTPTKSLDFGIPLQRLEDLTPTHFHPFDVDRLKPFGSLSFALEKKRISKVGPLARRFIFVGLESNARAARLWDKASSRILVTGDLSHREDIFPAKDPTHSPSVTQCLILPDLSDQTFSTPTMNSTSPLHDDNREDSQRSVLPETVPTSPSTVDTAGAGTHQETVQSSLPDRSHSSSGSDLNEPTPATPVAIEPTQPPLRRTERISRMPDRLGFAATLGRDSDHPTFQEAMNSADSKAWRAAMKDKYDSLMEHSVGTLVDPPPNVNIIGGMWIFNRKRDEFNRIVRFKARWVVFGNHQIKGVDYMETYASVGKIDSLRIMLGIGVSRGMRVRQFDVVTAFLNGDMEDSVYTIQVRGFQDPTQPNRVWKLNQSLYGTKQAARRWQQHFGRSVAEFNLRPTSSDSAVYVLKNDLRLLLIHLHVDDALIFTNSEDLFQKFKSFINSKYKLKWTESPSLYLGIKLHFSGDGKCIQISQPQYIETTLDRFAMTNCKVANTPFPSKTVLAPGSVEEVEAARDIPYQELVGSLQWITCCTCPDIAYAVSQLSKFNSAYTLEHWTIAKHVLQYLWGTATLGISYTAGDILPQVDSDSNFSQCPTTRRSISGYVVMISGGAACWKSQQQSVVALSTTEAEYIAAAECSKHTSWVRSFLFDIFHPVETPIPFHVDNTSAIFTATGEGIKSRSKHIDRRHHFIRDMVQLNLIQVKHVPTELMLADHLTKPLALAQFKAALSLNNLVDKGS